jgi:HlyD family secretion protein
VIYLVLLVSFVVAGLSLFYISVDVNVQSRGIITTPSKQVEIRNAIYGKLIHLDISENQFVHRGDIIAIVDTIDITRSTEINRQRLDLLTFENLDLKQIIKLNGNWRTSPKGLITLKYIQEFQKVRAELEYLEADVDNWNLDYERQQLLFKNKVISQVDFEQSRYRYQNAVLKKQQYKETQLAKWQDALVINNNQILTLKETLNSLEKERGMCFIKSPISGYVQNPLSLSIGSTLFSNQEICRISPEDSLIVEMYITPQDIGYISSNQTTKYRVDAFNSNRWGMLTGNVIDISHDITITDGNMLGFRVIGSLDRLNLSYEGNTVQIKKGMTLTANLILTKRTLAQLLFDDISKWLNPNEAENK